MKVHTMYVDGGAYHNGREDQLARICVVNEDEIVFHENIGNHTNNEAEFIAIERAIEWSNNNIRDGVVTVFSDSKLAVNMINYIWEGKEPRIVMLRDRIAGKMPKNVLIKWIYRDYNKAGQFLEFHLPRREI